MFRQATLLHQRRLPESTDRDVDQPGRGRQSGVHGHLLPGGLGVEHLVGSPHDQVRE